MNDRHAGPRPCLERKICRLGSKFLKEFALILPEVPASSAIVTASEEVPQVQDLEVDLSKIDLAKLVWGLGVSNSNTQNASGYVRLAKALRGSVKCLAPRSFAWPNLEPLMTKPRRSCPSALKESYLCWPNSTRRPGPPTGPGGWGLLSSPWICCDLLGGLGSRRR